MRPKAVGDSAASGPHSNRSGVSRHPDGSRGGRSRSVDEHRRRRDEFAPRRIARRGTVGTPFDAAAVTALDAQRESAGIAARQVLIELTESRPLDTRDAAEVAAFGAAMLRLRALGYGLAIDDVGPGTTNLCVLLGFGFTALKLDRAVVEDSSGSPAANRFLRETVAAARAADLVVIAEGVE